MKYTMINLISGKRMLFNDVPQPTHSRPNCEDNGWWLGKGWFSEKMKASGIIDKKMEIFRKLTRKKFMGMMIMSPEYMGLIHCPVNRVRNHYALMTGSEWNLWKENREVLYRESGYNRLRKYTSKIVRAWEVYTEFKERVSDGRIV